MIQTHSSVYHPRVMLNVMIRNPCFQPASLHLPFLTFLQMLFAQRTVFHPCCSLNVFPSFVHFSCYTLHSVILGGVLHFSPRIMDSFVASGADLLWTELPHLILILNNDAIEFFNFFSVLLARLLLFLCLFSHCVRALLPADPTQISNNFPVEIQALCLLGYVSIMKLSKSDKLSGWMLQKTRNVFWIYISSYISQHILYYHFGGQH